MDSLEMVDSQPLSIPSRRKTQRVRGPRPCSWISPSSDSSLNDHRDMWSLAVRGSLRRAPTLRSISSTESELSGSSTPSSSSSPVNTHSTLVEESYYGHARKRKPAGPRAPRNSLCLDVRPALRINPSLSFLPPPERENSPILPPIQSADRHFSPHIPPSITNSPTNFLLDWDAIFEVLECPDDFSDDTEGW